MARGVDQNAMRMKETLASQPIPDISLEEKYNASLAMTETVMRAHKRKVLPKKGKDREAILDDLDVVFGMLDINLVSKVPDKAVEDVVA